MTTKDVMLAWVKAFNDRDAAAAIALYDDHADNIQWAIGLPLRGKDAIRRDLEDLFRTVPDNFTDVGNLLVEGDRAAIEWFGGGTYRAEATSPGKKFELHGCGFFLIRNGKILKQRGYWDKATWFSQVGIPLE